MRIAVPSPMRALADGVACALFAITVRLDRMEMPEEARAARSIARDHQAELSLHEAELVAPGDRYCPALPASRSIGDVRPASAAADVAASGVLL